jgi:hypothetical protein
MSNRAIKPWVVVAGAVTMFFGFGTALGGILPGIGLESLLEGLFWPRPAEGSLSDAGRLLAVVGGGVMAGWGAMIVVAGRRTEPVTGPFIGRMIRTGLLVWFVTDSTGSALVGATLNVVGNLGFLAMTLIPVQLALVRQARPGGETQSLATGASGHS